MEIVYRQVKQQRVKLSGSMLVAIAIVMVAMGNMAYAASIDANSLQPAQKGYDNLLSGKSNYEPKSSFEQSLNDLKKSLEALGNNGKNKTKDTTSQNANDNQKQSNPNRLGNKTLNDLLYKAVRDRDLDMTNDALHRGANPNYTENGYGYTTPFLMAIQQRNLDMVQIFIAYGVDVNMKIFQNNGDNTPLYDAICYGSFDIVNTLVEAGANINTQLSPGLSYGWTAMVAFSSKDMNNQTNADMFNYLVSKGANVNVKNKYGTTLLMSSASAGNLKLTKMYLDLGLDPNKRNDEGKTALDYAISSNNKEVINLLLQITHI